MGLLIGKKVNELAGNGPPSGAAPNRARPRSGVAFGVVQRAATQFNRTSDIYTFDKGGDGRTNRCWSPLCLALPAANRGNRRLRIGDTRWDETMIPAESIAFELQGGLVIGISGMVTITRPEHPDLGFFLPRSPGTWVATDDRDGVNLGTISGNYELRDGVVPEPGTLALVLTSTLILSRCRRE